MYAGEMGKISWCVWETRRKRIKIFPAVLIEKRRVVKKRRLKIIEVYQLKEDMVPKLLERKLLDIRSVESVGGILIKPLKFSASIKYLSFP